MTKLPGREYVLEVSNTMVPEAAAISESLEVLQAWFRGLSPESQEQARRGVISIVGELAAQNGLVENDPAADLDATASS